MLEKKFKEYLEKEFRLIKPTVEAMEYRMEVLQNLLDRAQEYKIKGMTDEDTIYDLCIDSLGDFKSTLTSFQNKLDEVKVSAPKIGAYALIGIILTLVLVGTYLVVSFATGLWGKTWLIMVGGIFLTITVLLSIAIAKFVKKKKYIITRLMSHIIVILLFVFVFLCLIVLTNVEKTWLLFLAMVTVILWLDTTLAIVTHSKSALPISMLAIVISSVMAYLGLGILGGYWHPYWLIIIVGVIISLIVLAVYLLKFSSKKAKELQEKKKQQEEAFYTNWSK